MSAAQSIMWFGIFYFGFAVLADVVTAWWYR